MCIQRRLKAKPSDGANASPTPAGGRSPEQHKLPIEPGETEKPAPVEETPSKPSSAPQESTESWDSIESISFAPRSFEQIVNDLSNPSAVQAEGQKKQEDSRRQTQKEQFLGALLERECYALFRCDLAAFESEFLASRGESSKGYGREQEQARNYFDRRTSQAKSAGKESDQSKAVPVDAVHHSG